MSSSLLLARELTTVRTTSTSSLMQRVSSSKKQLRKLCPSLWGRDRSLTSLPQTSEETSLDQYTSTNRNPCRSPGKDVYPDISPQTRNHVRSERWLDSRATWDGLSWQAHIYDRPKCKSDTSSDWKTNPLYRFRYGFSFRIHKAMAQARVRHL